ncbi:hypothetical protein [Alistipes putredinis]|uniref:hypothetical protein n=1 Tax=Alistipes putredinis TaxID=28117 RepID=UPI003AEF6469
MKAIKTILQGKTLSPEDMSNIQGGNLADKNYAVICKCEGSNTLDTCDDNKNFAFHCICNGTEDHRNFGITCKCEDPITPGGPETQINTVGSC